MNGRYFTYDGENSLNFGLMIAGIDINDEVNLGLKREVLRGNFNRTRSMVHHMGATWSEPLSFDITFMKDACNNNYEDERMIFTEEDINEIAMWLTSADYPTLFHMYDYQVREDPYTSAIVVNFDEGDQHTYEIIADGYKNAEYTIIRDMWRCQMVYTSTEGADPPDLWVTLSPDYIQFSSQNEAYIQAITKIRIDGNSTEFHTFNVDKYFSIDDNNPDIYHYKHYSVMNHKYNYYGIFEDIQPQMVGDKIVALKATFTTNSPFAWTPEYSVTSNYDNRIIAQIRSAEKYREIYPLIAFTPKVKLDEEMQTEVTFRNTRDDFGIKLKLYQGVTTYLDCEKCLVYYTIIDPSDDDEVTYMSIDDIYEQDIETITPSGLVDERHIYWPRLYYGKNEIVITGDCSVTMIYREPRKVGEY